jgi:hypothetical protein
VIVAWVLANCWTFASSPIPESGRESLVVARIRELFALGVSAVLLVGLFWYWIRSVRSTWVICLVSAFFLATSLLILPGSLKQLETVGTRAEIDEFADWRDAIPPASNVLMLPTSKSASFMWFTLGRPSYWSVGQSAGVVFSRATSLEVKRRSDVLLPLADPDWRILTQIMEQSGSRHKPGSVTASNTSSRPLTDKILVSVCGDPQLGFVIAKEHVGLDPMRHLHIGAWKDWNLYDCRRVRSTSPGA